VSVALAACGGSSGDSEDESSADDSMQPQSGMQQPAGEPTPVASEYFGDSVSGVYHLGPVDFAETEWHNACAPAGGYRAELRDMTGLGGEYLAGLSDAHLDGGNICDTCIEIDTEMGNSIVARVVTYGVQNQSGDIDVSPSVYQAIHADEFPRSSSWRFAKCPYMGDLALEFQTEANPWWTSLWVRNCRVPIAEVAVKSANHEDFFALRREIDGTFNDDGGFGEGPFTLRVTTVEGESVSIERPGFTAGELVMTSVQF